MTNDVRELQELCEAFKRQHGARFHRIAALRKAPGGDKIARELKQHAGLAELLAAFDALGKPPDPAKATTYDRIRQRAAQKQRPVAGPPLDERLRRW